MIIAVVRPVRPYADLADITGKQILARGWVTQPDGTETYEVQYAVNLTVTEEQWVRIRFATADANEEAMQRQAWDVLADLRVIRDTGDAATLSPLQLSKAARLFAKVLIFLIRLQMRRTDAAD